MAPSAIETTTIESPAPARATIKHTGGVGQYKELAPIGYSKEAEEEGKDGFEAAKVT